MHEKIGGGAMKGLLPRVLALTILATGAAWAQSPPPPQQVSASPQVAPGAPDLVATMRALEDKLRARGRLTWTQSIRFEGGKVIPGSLWNEITNVRADPKACSLRVVETGVGSYPPYSFYLEEVSGADVFTWEDYLRNRLGGHGQVVSIEPSLYTVIVDSWNPVDLKFPTKDAAEQFAALLRESIKQCSAVPVTPKPAVGGGPGLTETLNFIADKLSTQGRVSSSVKLTRDNDPGWIRVAYDVDIFQVSTSPATCTMRMDATGMPITELRLSFRRIGKIEVMKFKDYMARFRPSNVDEAYRTIIEASPTFVLYITIPGGESKALYFSDETLANRVAKAINHAAELCGAGANKEPF
jgi:hypothetical protein